MLVDHVNTPHALAEQYKNSANLNARSAIYKFGSGKRGWPHWVFDHLLDRKPTDVLELGCGAAALWRVNFDRIPPAWNVTLTDISPGMLADAKSQLGENASRFNFARVDAQDVPFSDGSFDVVIANHMLYHVPDLLRALREIHRVLRPGGTLYAGTNGPDHLTPIYHLMDRFLGESFGPLVDHFCLDDPTAAKLKTTFVDVQTHHLRDEVRVPEPQPVVDYLLSVNGAAEKLAGGKMTELTDAIASDIKKHGAFVIPTHAGLFIATRES